MARRRGRPGDYLMADDYYGIVGYASEMRRDYWGMYAKDPVERNLQEIATPLNDPRPVSVVRGPNYEQVNPAITTVAPVFIGATTRKTNHNNAAFESGAVT